MDRENKELFMMIRDKIIRCTCSALLIMLAFLLGCADKAEAQVTVPNPVSIHDILSTTQITELKANETVKTIKRDKRDEIRTKTALEIWLPPSSRSSLQDSLMSIVENDVGLGDSIEGTGIKGFIMSVSGMDYQKEKFSDPDDEDGLAVRFAPSDAELGVE
ncbi:hypothetical protein KKHLCK_09600 [Candidatus Electrothrix laxa]